MTGHEQSIKSKPCKRQEEHWSWSLHQRLADSYDDKSHTDFIHKVKLQLALLIINSAAIVLRDLRFPACGMHPQHMWITVIMQYSMFFLLSLLVGAGPSHLFFSIHPWGKRQREHLSPIKLVTASCLSVSLASASYMSFFPCSHFVSCSCCNSSWASLCLCTLLLFGAVYQREIWFNSLQ